MIKIIVNRKTKAEIPLDNVKHKDFDAILKVYLHNEDWQKFTLERVEDK